MLSGRRAVVSIGTNSTRLLIAVQDGAHLAPVLHRSTGTRLGANLAHTGSLDSEGCARTLAAIDDYVCILREQGLVAGAIATSAMRRAEDGARFAAEVERRVGAPLEILSGASEAALSFRGATYAQRSGECVGVLDVGGGSSEYACGAGEIEGHASCEIGAVRLSEAIPALLGAALPSDPEGLEAQARALARERLAPLDGMPAVARVYAVGGTAFNAAMLLEDADREELDGSLLPRSGLAALARRFLAMDIAQRRAQPRISPQRADIFPAGLLIVDEALGLLGATECTLSRADLLLGYLVERYGAPPLL